MSKVIYYLSENDDNPVKKFLESLDKKQKAKIFRIFQYMEVYGLSFALPHIKKLTGTPLWEIKILGRDNIRVLYIALPQDLVLLLHGFFKKEQKTPQRDIDTALTRLKDYLNRQH